MARPDFLIVGAMKAGTTTLHQDLRSHPGIFLPVLKEPETLARLDDMGDIGREYDVLFRPARKGQKASMARARVTEKTGISSGASRFMSRSGPTPARPGPSRSGTTA